jgi:nitroreductase
MDTTADQIKSPDLIYDIHPLLAKRWSPRAYSDQPVEKEKLQRVVEAARWAPSSSNLQPWCFLFGYNNDPVFTAVYSAMVSFNQLWVKTAPVIGLAIGITHDPKGNPNRSYLYDLGQAVAMLSVQAVSEGLYVHQIGGFDRDVVASKLEIPLTYSVVTAFTVGYRGNPEVLHPNLLRLELSPRTRKPLDEFVFDGKFGQKASFL